MRAAPSRAWHTSRGFVPLFNGKDLTGWWTSTINKEETKWLVQDGCLTARGPRGHLFTLRNFRDFHLRTEVKLNKVGTATIIFRTSGVGIDDCYIAPLSAQPAANALLRFTRPFSKMTWYAPRPFPTDRWVVYEVIAQGNRVVLRVDGQIWADVTDSEPYLKSNRIGLQQGSPETNVQFRKIEVKELPLPKVPAKP